MSIKKQITLSLQTVQGGAQLVTFYQYDKRTTKGGMLFRIERKAHTPIFFYASAQDKVKVVCIGHKSRTFATAEKAWAFVITKLWPSFNVLVGAFEKGEFVSVPMPSKGRYVVELTSNLVLDEQGKRGYYAKRGKAKLFVYERFVREVDEWLVEVHDRSMLPDEEAAKCKKPWAVVWPDNTVEWFDTEDEACARQVELGEA